ncbi:hypothetical protein HK102_007708 [Quaeritorhiza haematococci]|nr:hypothetical protein HK102_007708 [Quaeritorhiza haematococci]
MDTAETPILVQIEPRRSVRLRKQLSEGELQIPPCSSQSSPKRAPNTRSTGRKRKAAIDDTEQAVSPPSSTGHSPAKISDSRKRAAANDGIQQSKKRNVESNDTKAGETSSLSAETGLSNQEHDVTEKGTEESPPQAASSMTDDDEDLLLDVSEPHTLHFGTIEAPQTGQPKTTPSKKTKKKAKSCKQNPQRVQQAEYVHNQQGWEHVKREKFVSKWQSEFTTVEPVTLCEDIYTEVPDPNYFDPELKIEVSKVIPALKEILDPDTDASKSSFRFNEFIKGTRAGEKNLHMSYCCGPFNINQVEFIIKILKDVFFPDLSSFAPQERLKAIEDVNDDAPSNHTTGDMFPDMTPLRATPCMRHVDDNSRSPQTPSEKPGMTPLRATPCMRQVDDNSRSPQTPSEKPSDTTPEGQVVTNPPTHHSPPAALVPTTSSLTASSPSSVPSPSRDFSLKNMRCDDADKFVRLVLLPEACVRMIMDRDSITLDQAEKKIVDGYQLDWIAEVINLRRASTVGQQTLERQRSDMST